ncbi:MAG: DEAD/DEAH box helicase family protein [Candidatus Delongbacteria bacterium]|nr:DEAD/DEAH box helicase family protein [Candidatus Delongbacteria bacterium]MBN2836673.1 DEAD/DEAH box helicase family protein [Candidatus Delongbacteria bacterium]
MAKNYDLKKFIIVVPSVAIREGVKKSFEMTKEHFETHYDPYHAFVYNSSNFADIKEFAISRTTQIMIINIDSFNKEITKIMQPQEATDGHKPIDLIKQTNPIIFIDEPQSVVGKHTKRKPSKGAEAILELNPLMIFRYSATHRVRSYDLYKLDAIDAYKDGLVKEIIVNSVTVDEDFNEPYIYVYKIERERQEAKLRLNVKLKNKYVRKIKTVKFDDDLSVITDNKKYEGFRVLEIGFKEGSEYIKIRNISNALNLKDNREFGATDSNEIKSTQIRETIKEHLEKEVHYRVKSKTRGRIKVLSLFFIDKVSNYVNYDGSERIRNGKFAIYFEEEYQKVLADKLSREKDPEKLEILKELEKQEVSQIHDGYFSNDKKTSFREYTQDKEGNYVLSQKDDSTFDLIMKDKEKLLSLDEPLRFIFSHSALKEGWDNPNVFQICTLNETRSEIKKRQEIGRGLRLAVDEFGNRIEEYSERNINKLTVMVNESYEEFTEGLQKEYEDAGIKFGVVESDTFTHLPSKFKESIGGENSIAIYSFLKENDYLDNKDRLNDKWRKDIQDKTFELPEDLKADQDVIINKLTKLAKTLEIKDGHAKTTIRRNDKIIASPEFLALWNRIKHKTRYEFKIDRDELIRKGVESLKDLDIDSLNIIARKSNIKIENEGIDTGEKQITGRTAIRKTQFPNVLIELQNSTNYSRNDLAKILSISGKLQEIKKNPERFLIEVSKRLNHAMHEYVMNEECIRYIKLGDKDCYVQENIFEKEIEVFDKYIVETRNKSVYSSFEYDSEVEKRFAESLENDRNVVLYTKLPKEFKIDTPIGFYNPDWALVYKDNNEYKVYFVIETKGTKDEFGRTGKENYKINCAELHFEALNKNREDKVVYKVVKKHEDLEKEVLKELERS